MTSVSFALSPLIAAVMTLMLGILVFPAVYRDRRRQVFLLVLFSVELWAVFTFAMRFSRAEAAAMIWDRVISVCLLFSFVAFFHFCHLYVGSRSRWPIYLLYAATAVAAAVALFTDLMVKGVTRFENGYAPQVGPAAYALLGPVQLLLVANVIRLLRASRHEASVVNSRRLLVLAIAGLLPFLGSAADAFTDLPPL